MPKFISSGKVSFPFRRSTATSVEKPEPLDHVSELAQFDILLEALGACGRSLAVAAAELEMAPPKLLAEIGRAFPDGEALPMLSSSFGACGAKLQQSKQHMATVQDLLMMAEKKGADVREAIAARDAAWAPKLEKDRDAEILNRRFGKAVSLQDKRTLLQAKHKANEDFRRSDEEAKKSLGSLLAQRWEVTAPILAEICRSQAVIFAGSQDLSSDFNRVVEQLLVPGVACEREAEERSSVEHLESAIRGQSSRSHIDGPTDRIARDGSPQLSADEGTDVFAREVSKRSCGSQAIDVAAGELDSSGEFALAADLHSTASPAFGPAIVSPHQLTASPSLSSPPAASDRAIPAEASIPRERPPISSTPALRRGSSSTSELARGRAQSAEVSVQPSDERLVTLAVSGAEPVAPACSLSGVFGALFATSSSKAEASAGRTAASIVVVASVPASDISDGQVPSDSGSSTPTSFRAGDKVQVWSRSRGGWVDAVVDKVFTGSCISDGYQVPAGAVQVSFDQSLKFIRPEQAGSQLRRLAAAGGA
mmetsp:Transcript_112705/g.283389  ORF Transcript_112705/g.283389 Transcript_112705/m.283389 type:complete len:537 (+) Transcript_112705:137-1747(+)